MRTRAVASILMWDWQALSPATDVAIGPPPRAAPVGVAHRAQDYRQHRPARSPANAKRPTEANESGSGTSRASVRGVQRHFPDCRRTRRTSASKRLSRHEPLPPRNLHGARVGRRGPAPSGRNTAPRPRSMCQCPERLHVWVSVDAPRQGLRHVEPWDGVRVTPVRDRQPKVSCLTSACRSYRLCSRYPARLGAVVRFAIPRGSLGRRSP